MGGDSPIVPFSMRSNVVPSIAPGLARYAHTLATLVGRRGGPPGFPFVIQLPQHASFRLMRYLIPDSDDPIHVVHGDELEGFWRETHQHHGILTDTGNLGHPLRRTVHECPWSPEGVPSSRQQTPR